MEIIIRQPLAFSEIGRKDNQEDCIYPIAENLTSSQKSFILCDGMGGHENGEVASQTVSSALGHFFESNPVPEEGDIAEYFNRALAAAYDALDSKDTSVSEKKMGTTMTCILFHKGGYMVAHIGDSRIYHVRPSNVSNNSLGFLYRSSDHSLVNSLLIAGEITAEEAKNFPQKNVITRAMLPNQGKRAKADIYSFSDVKPGDYFFMCCDGVLENLTDEKLGQILSATGLTDKEKIAKIKAECDGRTRDNYTCIMIPVDSVKGADNHSEDNFIAGVECEEPEDKNSDYTFLFRTPSLKEDGTQEKDSSDQTHPDHVNISKRQKVGSNSRIKLLLAVLITLALVLLYMRGIPKFAKAQKNPGEEFPASLPSFVADPIPDNVSDTTKDDNQIMTR